MIVFQYAARGTRISGNSLFQVVSHQITVSIHMVLDVSDCHFEFDCVLDFCVTIRVTAISLIKQRLSFAVRSSDMSKNQREKQLLQLSFLVPDL